MNYGAQVFALLVNDPGVGAKTLSQDGTYRIFPEVMVEDCLKPAVVYTVISDIPLNSLAGFTSGKSNARVQVDVYSFSYAEAQEVADAVESLLGAYVSVGFSSLQVSRRDLYENNTRLHRVSMDHSIWGEE